MTDAHGDVLTDKDIQDSILDFYIKFNKVPTMVKMNKDTLVEMVSIYTGAYPVGSKLIDVLRSQTMYGCTIGIDKTLGTNQYVFHI